MAVKSVRGILLAAKDDVAALLDNAPTGSAVVITLSTSGEVVDELTTRQEIPFGHKVAIHNIAEGAPIIRYSFPIGVATASIGEGEHVHSHNMRSLLSPAVTKPEKARERRPASWIRDLVYRCIATAGADAEVAEAFADAIVEAHLRGVETHGLRRVRPYIARIRSGGVDAKKRPVIEQTQAILRVDGRNGIGHFVATAAAKAVSAAARQHGVAIALVRNSNHFGFAGYYATQIASQGQLGLVISNGQICVGPEGATSPFLSNNPLAIGAPTGQRDAFFELDLATSVTSRANVVEAARTNTQLPPGWAQDAQGRPTRSARAALAGSLFAFGGDKGFALLLALEAMTGVLGGGFYGDQVSSKEAAPNAPEGTSHTFIAIDLAMALGVDVYCARLDDLLRRLVALSKGPDAKTLRYPGERRWKLREQRLRDGVPLGEADLLDLIALATELRVNVDLS